MDLMKLYQERRPVSGQPVNPQFQQLLVNEDGEIVWSCTVWADSDKSMEEADRYMMAFIYSRNEPVELLDDRYGFWQSFNNEDLNNQ